ncbi:hypothetical protein M9H77_23160 [Catharanthus roseus]|uniref:Uncharacterized protein n=1 Tax=Catharanthus roseus TaxID=4058 RepID=A0ACC0AS49_CATRO|nr:hypothetical protein M9H77_23160 [Catharanthus roseus]
MSTQAQAPTPFGEESSNSQHDDPLRLIMQELQSLRDEIRDIRRDVTNLSNQQREVSPHGSLNVTTPRSNGPFNCSRITEFHQPPHFDEELHPPPYGGRRDGFGGRDMLRHFEEVTRPQTYEMHVEHLREVLNVLRIEKLFANPDKCEFCLEKVTFLGYVGSSQGLQVDEGFIIFMDGHLPTKSHQAGTSDSTRMNLKETLRSMQQ